jgi:hypothetical protein
MHTYRYGGKTTKASTSPRSYKHTCMHACMHAYIHTYRYGGKTTKAPLIHTYINTYRCGGKMTKASTSAESSRITQTKRREIIAGKVAQHTHCDMRQVNMNKMCVCVYIYIYIYICLHACVCIYAHIYYNNLLSTCWYETGQYEQNVFWKYSDSCKSD